MVRTGKVVFLLTCMVVAMCVSALYATPLTIENWSFESPAQTGTNIFYLTDGDLGNNWFEVYNADANILRADANYPAYGGTRFDYAPDGAQVMEIGTLGDPSVDACVFHALGVNAEAGNIYTVSGYAGQDRANGSVGYRPYMGAKIGIYAKTGTSGNPSDYIPMAEAVAGPLVSDPGTFIPLTATATVAQGNLVVGSPLYVGCATIANPSNPAVVVAAFDAIQASVEVATEPPNGNWSFETPALTGTDTFSLIEGDLGNNWFELTNADASIERADAYYPSWGGTRFDSAPDGAQVMALGTLGDPSLDACAFHALGVNAEAGKAYTVSGYAGQDRVAAFFGYMAYMGAKIGIYAKTGAGNTPSDYTMVAEAVAGPVFCEPGTFIPLTATATVAEGNPVVGASLYVGLKTIANPSNPAVAIACFDDIQTSIESVPQLPAITYSDDITVDGDLSDWAIANWMDVNIEYWPKPNVSSDMSAGKVAWKWAEGGTKVYIAAKIMDTAHVFSDGYAGNDPANTGPEWGWDDSDRIEFQLGASSTLSGVFASDQRSAQQYCVGRNLTTNTAWATLGSPDPIAESVGLQYAVKEGVGEDTGYLFYEAAMTAFEDYGGVIGLPTIPAALVEGRTVFADIVMGSRNGSNYSTSKFNMVSTTDLVDKYYSTTQLLQQVLVRSGVSGTVTLTGYTGSLLGISGTVKVRDALGNVLETHKIVLDTIGLYTFETNLRGTFTIEVQIPGYAVGSQSVTIDETGNATADFSLASTSALPVVGASNKAVIDAIMQNAASNYIWVLWGKVTVINADSFTIDDGSGVTITVNATGHGLTAAIDNGKYVAVKGTLNVSSKTLTSQSVTKYN